jgi:hypothetical protein
MGFGGFVLYLEKTEKSAFANCDRRTRTAAFFTWIFHQSTLPVMSEKEDFIAGFFSHATHFTGNTRIRYSFCSIREKGQTLERLTPALSGAGGFIARVRSNAMLGCFGCT